MRTTIKVLAATAVLAVAQPADAQVRLRFSGFGDFIGGTTIGSYADPSAREQFMQFGGGEAHPKNTTRGFGITGTDFVIIADMDDNFTFLGEINLQAARGASDEMELDVERFFLDYRIDPRLNLQAGLFFTPIGYNNRFLYARAWLMNSIQVPDFYEEELNLVPTHSIGVAAYGQFRLPGRHKIGYIVSTANGRAPTPDGAIYARDPSDAKEFTGLVEWLIPGYKESRVGVSGWTGDVQTVYVPAIGDVVASEDADALELSERGIDIYAVINRRHWTLNVEMVRSWQRDLGGNQPTEMYNMSAGMAEFSLHLNGARLHPFIRYDESNLPQGGGSYLSLRADGDDFTRVYVPEFQAFLTGAAYDLTHHLRVKFEYIRHLGGPRQKNALTLQAAFGF